MSLHPIFQNILASHGLEGRSGALEADVAEDVAAECRPEVGRSPAATVPDYLTTPAVAFAYIQGRLQSFSATDVIDCPNATHEAIADCVAIASHFRELCLAGSK